MTVQIYLKPRSVSLVHGHYHYLPFYSSIIDHTLPMERYPAMLQKSTLSSLLTLSTLFNDFIPSIDVDVPDPSKFDRSAWPDLLELAKMKVSFALDLRVECENHIIQLSQGDHAPAPPPRTKRPPPSGTKHCSLPGPEVSLSCATVDGRTVIWSGFRREMHTLMDPILPAHLPSSHTEKSGLFNLLSKKASIFASALTTKITIDDDNPPLLSKRIYLV
ncbi:hypothetical protein EDD85DRAFT_954994 [Armillaria nabsnona]|nr:hypothetical protein EDD85DRAFT_954994 [Armillaria nabsnona]